MKIKKLRRMEMFNNKEQREKYRKIARWVIDQKDPDRLKSSIENCHGTIKMLESTLKEFPNENKEFKDRMQLGIDHQKWELEYYEEKGVL
jgi:hypothetical protein